MCAGNPCSSYFPSSTSYFVLSSISSLSLTGSSSLTLHLQSLSHIQRLERGGVEKSAVWFCVKLDCFRRRIGPPFQSRHHASALAGAPERLER